MSQIAAVAAVCVDWWPKAQNPRDPVVPSQKLLGPSTQQCLQSPSEMALGSLGNFRSTIDLRLPVSQ